MLFSFLEVMLIFIALQFWFLFANYLAKKPQLSLLSSMVFGFLYSMAMWGIIFFLTATFSSHPNYDFYNIYDVLTISTSALIAMMTALICYHARMNDVASSMKKVRLQHHLP